MSNQAPVDIGGKAATLPERPGLTEGPRGSFYEFFAGGGMARLGLGPRWQCLFANEWSARKAASYRAYFGACPELAVEDVAKLSPADLPGQADLAWASFPCQDLSLAGNGAGLDGERSGAFKPFWSLMSGLIRDGRAPRLVVLENVTGTLTSHGGKDFAYLVGTLVDAGYHAGAIAIDAVRFLPQSRPRVFFVAARRDVTVGAGLLRPYPSAAWHPKPVMESFGRLPKKYRESWVWWRLPEPSRPTPAFSDLIEERPAGVEWHSKEQTRKLLRMMSELNAAKVRDAREAGCRRIGTIYKRTRPDSATGGRVQRAEVRFDEVAGCLRTPAGGSSRQIVLVVEGQSARSRLLSPREIARLMGVPDDYPLPAKYNDAYHLFGDGLAVPAVRWLADHLLLPLVSGHASIVAA